MPRYLLYLAVAAVASTGSSGALAQGASVEAYWATKGFVVQISRCSDGLCGKLAGLDERAGPDGDRLDRRNSDRSKRQRPLCGIEIVGNFKPSNIESGKWEGGWIYNPEDGRTYKSEMHLVDPNTIKARGYILTKLFGRDVTLIRENRPGRRCSVDTVSAASLEARPR
jgi:uncharacterized protein (DUF2147 family)